MQDERDAVQFVLADGRLSGEVRDRILDRVLAETAPRRRPRWLAWLAAGLVPAAAAVTAAIVMTARPGPDVRPKGAPAVTLQARCPDSPAGVCRRGDRLLFEVDGADGGGFVAAYAQHASGERVWYFPTADGHLARVPSGGGHVLIGEAVRIGPEHAPGRYTLHLLFLDRALDRAAILGLAEDRGGAPGPGRTAVPLEILP